MDNVLRVKTKKRKTSDDFVSIDACPALGPNIQKSREQRVSTRGILANRVSTSMFGEFDWFLSNFQRILANVKDFHEKPRHRFETHHIMRFHARFAVTRGFNEVCNMIFVAVPFAPLKKRFTVSRQEPMPERSNTLHKSMPACKRDVAGHPSNRPQ